MSIVSKMDVGVRERRRYGGLLALFAFVAALGVLGAIGLGGSVMAAPSQPDACLASPSNMAAWLPGDNHGFDIKGSNHGVLLGNIGYTSGKVGPAFNFDGVNDEVLVPQMNLGSNYTVDF
ncbi:MAG TPA: hypothetical protein VEW94_05120, partial [Chloroflexia bacterium]|nr:hypothetical protein [Chloroflexia bacterium]